MIPAPAITTAPAIRQQLYYRPVVIESQPTEWLTCEELCKRYIDYIDRKKTTTKGYIKCLKQH